MSSMPTVQEMERAYLGRDASYDGIFFIGVRSTGIFCRPSCPARKPLPKNVEFFASAREALFGGYRPCLRCRPMDANGRPPAWVGRLLARVDEVPAERISDDDLRAMSIDPARARRYFKKSYGMTFQVYSRARRMGVALGQIREGTDLTSVALGHGYDSNSGFRHAFERTFGGPPGRCRSEECLVTQMIESPIGRLMACATSSAVCLLEFTERRSLESQVDTLRKRFRRAIVPGANAHLQQLREELAAYFAGERAAFSVAIDYPGTPFQVAVWDRLLQIPYGETLSYSRLAEDVGRQGASRAAGRANGDNRLAILIPCHRVVNKNGRLGGYGGGLWRKQFLLDLERGGAA